MKGFYAKAEPFITFNLAENVFLGKSAVKLLLVEGLIGNELSIERCLSSDDTFPRIRHRVVDKLW